MRRRAQIVLTHEVLLTALEVSGFGGPEITAGVVGKADLLDIEVDHERGLVQVIITSESVPEHVPHAEAVTLRRAYGGS